MRRPAPRRKAAAARRERRDALRFVAGLWALLLLLWLGIDTTSAMTLRARVSDLPPLAVGRSAVIDGIGPAECWALSSQVLGPLFPQTRRVGLPPGVVVERARCGGHGGGGRYRDSTVRVVRVE